MRLGLNIGYFGAGYAANGLELAREADRLGYAVCWVAEAFGSDAATVLGWLACHTNHIRLGSSVLQIPARSAAMTAMTAATLDVLSGGRFILGLGISGPQVSEGWHGVRFGDPIGRTREYVDVVRKVLAGDRLTYGGRHQRLPLPDSDGVPLRLSVRPIQEHLPLYLAAIGPRSLKLVGEMGDGWLASFFSPEFASSLLSEIRSGRSVRSTTCSAEALDVVSMTPLALGDDVRACADAVRWYAALYLGGMGSKVSNYYNQLAQRMGFREEASRVQELYLKGDLAGAAASVPFEFIDTTSLIGPKNRIGRRMEKYAETGVTTLAVSPFGGRAASRLNALRVIADLFGKAEWNDVRCDS